MDDSNPAAKKKNLVKGRGGSERALNNKFSNNFTINSMLSDEDDEGAFAELEQCLLTPVNERTSACLQRVQQLLRQYCMLFDAEQSLSALGEENEVEDDWILQQVAASLVLKELRNVKVLAEQQPLSDPCIAMPLDGFYLLLRGKVELQGDLEELSQEEIEEELQKYPKFFSRKYVLEKILEKRKRKIFFTTIKTFLRGEVLRDDSWMFVCQSANNATLSATTQQYPQRAYRYRVSEQSGSCLCAYLSRQSYHFYLARYEEMRGLRHRQIAEKIFPAASQEQILTLLRLGVLLSYRKDQLVLTEGLPLREIMFVFGGEFELCVPEDADYVRQVLENAQLQKKKIDKTIPQKDKLLTFAQSNGTSPRMDISIEAQQKSPKVAFGNSSNARSLRGFQQQLQKFYKRSQHASLAQQQKEIAEAEHKYIPLARALPGDMLGDNLMYARKQRTDYAIRCVHDRSTVLFVRRCDFFDVLMQHQSIQYDLGLRYQIKQKILDERLRKLVENKFEPSFAIPIFSTVLEKTVTKKPATVATANSVESQQLTVFSKSALRRKRQQKEKTHGRTLLLIEGASKNKETGLSTAVSNTHHSQRDEQYSAIENSTCSTAELAKRGASASLSNLLHQKQLIARKGFGTQTSNKNKVAVHSMDLSLTPVLTRQIQQQQQKAHLDYSITSKTLATESSVIENATRENNNWLQNSYGQQQQEKPQTVRFRYDEYFAQNSLSEKSSRAKTHRLPQEKKNSPYVATFLELIERERNTQIQKAVSFEQFQQHLQRTNKQKQDNFSLSQTTKLATQQHKRFLSNTNENRAEMNLNAAHSMFYVPISPNVQSSLKHQQTQGQHFFGTLPDVDLEEQEEQGDEYDFYSSTVGISEKKDKALPLSITEKEELRQASHSSESLANALINQFKTGKLSQAVKFFLNKQDSSSANETQRKLDGIQKNYFKQSIKHLDGTLASNTGNSSLLDVYASRLVQKRLDEDHFVQQKLEHYRRYQHLYTLQGEDGVTAQTHLQHIAKVIDGRTTVGSEAIVSQLPTNSIEASDKEGAALLSHKAFKADTMGFSLNETTMQISSRVGREEPGKNKLSSTFESHDSQQPYEINKKQLQQLIHHSQDTACAAKKKHSLARLFLGSSYNLKRQRNLRANLTQAEEATQNFKEQLRAQNYMPHSPEARDALPLNSFQAKLIMKFHSGGYKKSKIETKVSSMRQSERKLNLYL